MQFRRVLCGKGNQRLFNRLWRVLRVLWSRVVWHLKKNGFTKYAESENSLKQKPIGRTRITRVFVFRVKAGLSDLKSKPR